MTGLITRTLRKIAVSFTSGLCEERNRPDVRFLGHEAGVLDFRDLEGLAEARRRENEQVAAAFELDDVRALGGGHLGLRRVLALGLAELQRREAVAVQRAVDIGRIEIGDRGARHDAGLAMRIDALALELHLACTMKSPFMRR